LVANSTTDGCWFENCAGNHQGQHHTDKSKNKAVVAVLEVGSFVGVVEQRHGALLIRRTRHCTQYFPTAMVSVTDVTGCAFRYGWDGVRVSRLFLDGPRRREAAGVADYFVRRCRRRNSDLVVEKR
jgi:hypothetical protein